MPIARWWEDEQVIVHRLAGVFEGGGAKGIAYIGALKATKEKKCWFTAVAGSSAGAITAALIASGLDPDDLETKSRDAMKRLSPDSFLRGLRRLRLHFGYLDSLGLHKWLEELLARQVKKFGIEVDGPVTFATLYQATEIELNVVAADLSVARQIVFSVWDTPGVQVADAVMASSSIPFAFAPRNLRVPYGQQFYTHTVVDGGVWSNFPTFVFSDRSFRRASQRPDLVAEDHVVGYLLDEQDDEAEADLTRSSFVGSDDAPDSLEWRVSSPDRSAIAPSIAKRFVGLLVVAFIAPLAIVVRFGAWLSLGASRTWRGRWPRIGGARGIALSILDDSFAAVHSAWFAVPVAVAAMVGSGISIYVTVSSWLLPAIEEVRLEIMLHDVRWLVVARILLTIVSAALILTLTVLVLALLASDYFLLGPVRQILYGLLRTYAAGPGAPAWVGKAEEDHVLRLPIPRALTTLSFEPTVPAVAEAISKAIADAHSVTLEGLNRILSSPVIKGPPRPHVVGVSAQAVSSARTSGGGPHLWYRLVVIASVVTALVYLVSRVIPVPYWFRAGVGLALCADELKSLDGPCHQPPQDSTHVTFIFDSASAGHTSVATMAVNDTIVERSASERTPPGGRLVQMRMDWSSLCKAHDCKVTFQALLDGRKVHTWTLERRVKVDTTDVRY